MVILESPAVLSEIRGRRLVRPHPSASRRVPSETARRAAEAFAELQTYFATGTQLRQALAWSAPTLRQWQSEQSPARPRVHSARRVFQLLDVARAAAQWVSDPRVVGQWLLAPEPYLGGHSPASALSSLLGQGDDGARLLIEKMAYFAPQERAATAVTMPADRLRSTLLALGAPTVAPTRPVEDVDVSDFA